MGTRWDVAGSAEQLDAALAARDPACLWDPSVLAEIGSRGQTAEILTLFTRQMSDGLPQLGEAITTDASREVRELAHRLKGSATVVGAPTLARLCDALCNAPASAGTARAMLYARLLDAWHDTLQAITAYVEQTSSDPRRAGSGTSR